ncbi:orotate phosphoribosyltransferase [Thermodesulfatator indicus DSM 15286]|uniref:Orotate phosphoribosyltransferase n=1 Tax=Thermodesulfatator indicus (strain DSM 15286 / JCM 11887 / CIR29812) TaxID=667014 RepID=F8AAY9_THEID|nr:orotate phosphoribosyltransferase [Thermodesulfatator indicus]AEH44355.1 orotate phosphoribosyltransferase [Thermodesulfatator indicus DSM 15286]
MQNERQKLFELLFERSFLYRPEGFRLASGKISPYYLDCKKTTLCAEALPLIGKLMWQEVKNFTPEAVGGLTLGADPLVSAVCFQAGLEGTPLEGFIVRKEAKGHGTQNFIEGAVKKGMKAVILEDVVTTGGSSLKAVSRARDAGLEVLAVVALVDREEGGLEAIKAQGLSLISLFTINEFLDRLNG